MPMNSFWRTKFAWSVSRHNQWKECKKQYYFDKIKKYDGLPKDPGREILWRLSELQKMPFLKGRIIHDAIQQQISNYNAGRDVNLDNAKDFFTKQFDNSIKNMDIILAEASNGFPPSEDKTQEIKEDGLKQIENFCSLIWNNYRSVKYLGHEKNDSFILDGIKVNVKYDLLTEKNGLHVITDWKTGSSGFDDIDENIQVGTYILWLHKTKGIPTEMIRGETVYLKSCSTEITKRSDADLWDLSEFIKEDAAAMLSVKSEADFSPSPSPKKCRGCNFLKLCKEGQEVALHLTN